MYKAGLVIESMATTFQRTPGALRARLVKLCFEANGVNLLRSVVKPEGDGKVWDREDDDLLEALYSAGLAMPLLSKSLRRSEWVIAYRLVDLGIAVVGPLDQIRYAGEGLASKTKNAFRGWKHEEFQYLRTAFVEGQELAELAELTGRTEINCLVALHAAGEIQTKDLDAALSCARSNG
jgi:hypothetical protein